MTAPHLAYANIFARDIEGLSKFYADLFGFPEVVGHRSPIYRCLDVGGGVELGFNAEKAYELLGLADRKPSGKAPVVTYFSIEVGNREAVDTAVAGIAKLGGRVVKPPYVSYYNAYQSVLEDPEGNIFRVNHRMGAREPSDKIANPPWK